jgi:putative acetyltransferase
MLIRTEHPRDAEAISSLLADVFALPDSPGEDVPEVVLVQALRRTDAWIPQQSLVATIDEELVGYCLCTRAHVDEVPCLALGPLAVTPDTQRRGVGTALVHEAIDIATDMSEPLIGLLGDRAYYRRFGFVPSRVAGIDPPDPSWGDYFQVKVLAPRPRVSGVFRYASPFRALG